MISKGLNAMPALSKFLVLLALILLTSHSNAFTSLSSVAGNEVWVNHLTQLQQLMSNPMNKPSCKPSSEPTWELTIRMDLDAELPNNLSPNQHESCNASLLVACAKCLKPHESSNASLLVACAECLNSNVSSCASLLVARAKCLKPQESSRLPYW